MPNFPSLEIKRYLTDFILPEPNSHKGQNGKLLIIGGSDLFHAASRWSLDIASKFVDMVFYSSIPSNNQLVQEAKGKFWNGIVIDRDDLESYLKEADCVLIGPGMTRERDTKELVDALLKKYPEKKWVIDAGALQMIDVSLLNKNCIITPHRQEFLNLKERVEEMLQQDLQKYKRKVLNRKSEVGWTLNGLNDEYLLLSLEIQGATIVRKGIVDVIARQDPVCLERGHHTLHVQEELELIEGGNAGMTKGGTGDVLAGLIAALYCKHSAFTAAVLGSYFNKKAGDDLYKEVGPNFNSSDLVNQIPKTIWNELQTSHAGGSILR